VANEKKGILGKLFRFFRETRSELKKVAWPNRKELVSFTSVVFASVALAALFIWIVDIAFGQMLSFIIR
jgi:preprotein translocase subunit SecE